MGFSAGGEEVALVSRMAVTYDPNAGPIDCESAVPSFQALFYSVPLRIRGEMIT
jgi:hypothetical protein